MAAKETDPSSSKVARSLSPEVRKGIARMVDSAPPLTEHQLAVLKILFRPKS
jgi:hypothetical protein